MTPQTIDHQTPQRNGQPNAKMVKTKVITTTTLSPSLSTAQDAITNPKALTQHTDPAITNIHLGPPTNGGQRYWHGTLTTTLLQTRETLTFTCSTRRKQDIQLHLKHLLHSELLRIGARWTKDGVASPAKLSAADDEAARREEEREKEEKRNVMLKAERERERIELEEERQREREEKRLQRDKRRRDEFCRNVLRRHLMEVQMPRDKEEEKREREYERRREKRKRAAGREKVGDNDFIAYSDPTKLYKVIPIKGEYLARLYDHGIRAALEESGVVFEGDVALVFA